MLRIHHASPSNRPRAVRLFCVRFFALFAIAVVCGGCLGPKQSRYITTRPINMERGSDRAERLWQAAGDAVRSHGFTLDRTDWREGVITTLPETSSSIFEFWRHDVQTNEDLWESTVNPIRRWIEVRVDPDDSGFWRALTIVVHKQRLSSLDRQFNSTGAAYQYFGDSLPSTTGSASVSSDNAQWIDIGEDPALAERLLTFIWEHARLEADHADSVSDG